MIEVLQQTYLTILNAKQRPIQSTTYSQDAVSTGVLEIHSMFFNNLQHLLFLFLSLVIEFLKVSISATSRFAQSFTHKFFTKDSDKGF